MTDTDSNASHPNPAFGAVERYVAFWNAATADQQRRIAAETFTGQISYHAPAGVMTGVDQLIDFRNQFAQHAPDYLFQPRAEPQAHHDRARLQWELVVAGGSFATGTDVLELDDDGHIAAIVSFLDRAPDGFAHAGH